MPDLVRRFPDPAAVARAAADAIEADARTALAERGRFSLVLSGGSTPKLLYTLLADAYAHRVDWPRVDVYFGDERCVAPDNPDSNFRMATQAMLARLPAAVHRIPAELGPRVAAQIYDGALPQTAPLFDLVLLGMGPDGHTASLFPGHDFAADRGFHVTPATAPAGFAIPDRVSLTRDALGSSRRVLALITGKDKAHRLAEVLRERASGTPTFPMSRIRPEGIEFLVDEAAATP